MTPGAQDRLTDGTAAWHFAEGQRAERERMRVEGITADRIAALEAECARLRASARSLKRQAEAMTAVAEGYRELLASGLSPKAAAAGIKATIAGGPEAGLMRSMVVAMAEYQNALHESEAVSAHDRIAALEAECARLRRERDALRLACQALITDGTDLARLVERARSLLGAFDGGRGAEVDPALLAWARCVVAARGAVDGAE